MDGPVIFKGIIEYLHWYIDIPRKSAMDIASYLDLENLNTLWDVQLDAYIPEHKIQTLRNKLKTHPLLPSAFLLGITFTPIITDLIIKHYGGSDSLIKEIEENPYTLIDLEEISFKKLDKVATEVLNIPLDSPLRYKALVFYQLSKESFRNGHLYTNLDKFINSNFELDICKNDLKNFLKELILEGKIILEGKKLYTQQYYKAEKFSAEIISKLISNSGRHLFFEGVDVDQYISGYEKIQTENIKGGEWKNLKWKENKFELSNEQKDAINKFFNEKFFILTGLPGSGKTSITKALVDISKNRGLKVVLLAPTGIAAKRLAETCGHEAFTIHKELGFDGSSWKKGLDNPIDADIIIVDEFSMVDQLLLYKLLLSLPKKEFALVFVGDAAQLPSVGPGNVLRELILCDKIPHVSLNKIFRQEDASDIVLNSHQINKGSTQLYNTKKDFVFLEIEHEEDTLKKLITVVEALQDKNYQVLSPTYKGILGVSNINKTLQDILNPKFDSDKEFKTEICTFREDDKVMIIKNDYKNDVYNGEKGILVNINQQNKKLEIFIEGKTIEYTFRDAYAMLALDYSRTIHKCININSYIPTSLGLLNFSEILEEFKIKNSEEFTKKEFFLKLQGMYKEKETSEIFKKSNVNTYKIVTERGYRIESTYNHPLMTVDKYGNFLWKNSEEISEGDLILIKKGFNVSPKNNVAIPVIDNTISKRKKLVLGTKILNKDIAWLMGIIVGDGHYNDKTDHSIQISTSTKRLNNQIKKVVHDNFGIECHEYTIKGKSNYALHIISKSFREIMLDLGLSYVIAHDKKIPISIRKSTPEIMASFLSGLFDSDGGANLCGIHFTTVSYDLALGVSNILLYFGIASSFKDLKNKAHRIYIQGEDSREFITKIGFREESRLNNLDRFNHIKRGYFVPKSNVSFIPNDSSMVLQLRNVLKSKYAKDKKTVRYLNNLPNVSRITKILSNVIKNKYRLSTYHLNLIEKYIPDTTIPEWLAIAKFKGFYIDKVKSIQNSRCDVFDFCVPEGHDFVSNGFISHNSQGNEYDYIVMPFVNYFSIQLQRNLLYTAITRAKKKVFILGHKKALFQAINNNNVSKRNTILSSRILNSLHDIKGET